MSRKRSRNNKQSCHFEDDAPPKKQRKGQAPQPVKRLNLLPILPKTRGQETLIDAIKNHEITICDGPAGTGKTLISFGSALHYRESDHRYKRIIIVRPVLPSGDDDEIGYLPGDINEKLGPYTAPLLRDAASLLIECDDYASPQEYDELLKEYLLSLAVEVIPLSMLRGRSLNNAFIILDEAQNCTMKDFELFVTRIGKHCKVIIEGDSSQADREDSGLVELQDKFEGLSFVKNVRLETSDIVRNANIAAMLKRLQ